MNYIMQSLCYMTMIITIFTVSAIAEFRENMYVKTLNNCLKEKPAYVGTTASKLQCSLQCTAKDECDLFDYSSQDKQCFLSGNMRQRDVGNGWTEATDAMKNVKKEVYVKKKSMDLKTQKSSGDWKNCADVYNAGYTQSGVYNVTPTGLNDSVQVYCDHCDGGGWTVFQRRIDGSVLFNRTWNGYKDGFGKLETEFWMGNDLLSLMTLETDMTLRIDLMDFNNGTAWAQYTNFKVQPENQNYMLRFNSSSYSGTAGDGNKGLSPNNNMQFSTIDRDNDISSSRHCATDVIKGGDGGWWYKFCTHVNLNGYYKLHHSPGSGARLYIVWIAWKIEENLKRTTMKFRPSNF